MENRWEEIKVLLSQEVTQGGFTLWFSQLDGKVIDTILYMYPPTEYAGQRILVKYRAILEKVTTELLGFTPTLEMQPMSVRNTSATKAETQMVYSQAPREKNRISHSISHAMPHPTLATYPVAVSPVKEQKTEISSMQYSMQEEKTIQYSIPKQYSMQEEKTNLSSLLDETFTTLLGNTVSSTPVKARVVGEDIPSSCGMSIPLSSYDNKPIEQRSKAIETPSQGYMNLHYSKRDTVFQHSFDSFIVGSSNMLAHASSRALCDVTNSLASCLYVSSAPGLGKTHLMHALGLELTKVSNIRKTHIEYLSAEDLTTQFTMALQQKQLTQFLGRLKSADVFLLEDVHFLQGKEKMQAQLLSVVKALQAKGSKIVFSSSFSLKEIRDIDIQLASCFKDGYVANISLPDLDFRREVIKRKALFHNVFIPEPVTEAIAENICSDIRQIEGCLKTLILKARAMNQEISLAMALDVLSVYGVADKIISFDDIVSHVCMVFGISKDRLASKTRQKECVLARNVIFYLARTHTDMTLKEVANNFNRQHSTVIKGVTNIEQEITRATPKAQQILSIVNMFDSGSLLQA